MTANASNNSGFEDFLNQLRAGKDRAGNAVQNFREGFNAGQQGPIQGGRFVGPYASNIPEGRAAAAGANFYNAMTPTAGRAALIGGLTAGTGALLQGQDVGQVAGSTVGGVSASMLAAKLSPALMRMGVPGVIGAAALNVAAPILGGEAGKNIISGIGNLFTGPAQAASNAATTGMQASLSNQLNPNSPRNITGDSIEENIALYKQLEATVGKQAADAYLQQKNLFGLATQADRDKAATTAMLSPVKLSSDLAKMGLGIQGQLALKNLDGGNQVLSNISSTNPYAQMLLA